MLNISKCRDTVFPTSFVDETNLSLVSFFLNLILITTVRKFSCGPNGECWEEGEVGEINVSIFPQVSLGVGGEGAPLPCCQTTSVPGDRSGCLMLPWRPMMKGSMF